MLAEPAGFFTSWLQVTSLWKPTIRFRLQTVKSTFRHRKHHTRLAPSSCCMSFSAHCLWRTHGIPPLNWRVRSRRAGVSWYILHINMNTSYEGVNTKKPTNIIGDHCPSRFWQSFLLWTKKVKIVQNSFGVSVGCLFQLSICWVQIEEGAVETRSAYWKPHSFGGSKTGPFPISPNIIKISSNA